MAGIKITDLPAAPSAQLTDVFPVDQLPGPVTYKESNQQLFSLFQANGAALTKVDDTNVTMTLSGSPATALLNATTMSLGWTGQLSVPRGGTGLSALTAHYIPIGNGISSLTLLAPSATSGIPLISQGSAADPAYGTAVVAGGGTGNTTFTAYSVICAGTTSTGAFQNVSGVGSANQVLVSNGAGALPSWQSVPGLTPAALTKVDDTNITLTLGGTPATALLQATSITAGWTGQLSETRGGTAQSTYTLGDTLYSSAANTLSKLPGNITTTKQYLSQTGSGAVSAAPAWATIGGSDITGAALTKTDDTNVTLTLGGTPATALLRAASITAGWTGTLSLARGGTAASLTASNGGIIYSNATTLAVLNGTATANQVLMSGSSAAPSWSTAVYPATVTANNILYASGSNVVGQLTPGTGVITALGQNVTGSGGIVLGTSATITTPRMSEIDGTLGNKVLLLRDNASSVNSIIVDNAATGASPVLTATGSDANVALYLLGTGNLGVRVQGITSGSTIPAGYIGEKISSSVTSGSKVTLTTATPANITSIALTAGEWAISWGLLFETAGTTSITVLRGGASSTTASVAASTVNYSQSLEQVTAFVPGVTTFMHNGATTTLSLSGSQTVYLNAQATFTISNLFAYGWILARRVG